MQKKWLAVLSIFFVLLFAVVSFVTPAVSFAQTATELGIDTIEAPPGVELYQAKAGTNIGLVFFISKMIQLFTLVCGVWVIFNGTLAGYYFIQSSGDASAYEKARNQITQSTIGLIIIVLSYTVTGLVSLVFFGDAGFLLNPSF